MQQLPSSLLRAATGRWRGPCACCHGEVADYCWQGKGTRGCGARQESQGRVDRQYGRLSHETNVHLMAAVATAHDTMEVAEVPTALSTGEVVGVPDGARGGGCGGVGELAASGHSRWRWASVDADTAIAGHGRSWRRSRRRLLRIAGDRGAPPADPWRQSRRRLLRNVGDWGAPGQEIAMIECFLKSGHSRTGRDRRTKVKVAPKVVYSLVFLVVYVGDMIL